MVQMCSMVLELVGWHHLVNCHLSSGQHLVHCHLSSGQAGACLLEHYRVHQRRGDPLIPAGYGDGWEFARFTLRGVELPGDAAPTFLPGARPAQPSICMPGELDGGQAPTTTF